MGRISASDAQNLYNAYASVYTQHPQEETLTEEQVWEEVEAWVNSLIEEGYDLSQYTWEEVFQVYVDGFEQLDEQGQRGSGMRNAPSDRFQQQLSGVGSFFRGLGSQGTMQGGRSRFNNRKPMANIPPSEGTGRGGPSDIAKKPMANIPPSEGTGRGGPSDIAKKPAPAPAAATPPKDVIDKAAKGGVPGTLNKTTGKWTASAPAAGAPTKPVAGGDTKPTTPTGATVADKKPAPPSTTSAAPRPTGATQGPAGAKIDPNSVRAALARENKPNILGNTKSAMDAERIKARTATIANKKTPAPRVMGARERMLNQDLDLFDVVKGHLVREGYADTEEAALAIMANMSEEWRESIVEGLLGSGSGFLGSNAAELGAKGGHDALPWNKNTKYTTQGRLRKPGENVRGERILNPPDRNKTTSAVTSDGKPR